MCVGRVDGIGPQLNTFFAVVEIEDVGLEIAVRCIAPFEQYVAASHVGECCGLTVGVVLAGESGRLAFVGSY